jgi:raffinose/stachyose/melibiose transport system permease protein
MTVDTAPAPTETPPPAIVGRRPRRWSTAVIYVIAILVVAVVIVPIGYVIIGGFRTSGQISNKPFGLPNPWVWTNYSDVLSLGAFWQEVWNSIFIALVTTFLVVMLGSLAAFALSRYAFRGREAIYTFFTIGLLFPSAVAILPLYVLLRDIGWLNTAWAVAIPQVAFGLPLTIVILRPFMRAVPAELEDAAVIDGCSRFGFYWRILMPLSRPALVTVAVLAFIGSWNAYLLPLLVFDDPSRYTLPLGTALFQSDHSADTAKILAFTAVSMIPALTFFTLMERRIIGGLSGSVKG